MPVPSLFLLWWVDLGEEPTAAGKDRGAKAKGPVEDLHIEPLVHE